MYRYMCMNLMIKIGYILGCKISFNLLKWIKNDKFFFLIIKG